MTKKISRKHECGECDDVTFLEYSIRTEKYSKYPHEYFDAYTTISKKATVTRGSKIENIEIEVLPNEVVI